MALGKGLGAILEEVGYAYENELKEKEFSQDDLGEVIQELKVEDIDPNPYQPRKDFDLDRLKELAESIQRYGLLQPVVVIPNGKRWLLVAGERRLRAHKLIEASTIRAIVADVDLDNLRMRELALVENIQREELSPIELAEAYRELIEVHGITHEELAGIVYKSRSQITNTLRLLSLSEYARTALTKGLMSQGHAKVLLSLPEEKQRIIVDTIVGQKLSVRDTEELVRQTREDKTTTEPSKAKHTSTPSVDPKIAEALENLLPFSYRITRKGVEIRLSDSKSWEKFINFLNQRNI